MAIWFKCVFCSFCTTKIDKFIVHRRESHPISEDIKALYKNAEAYSGNEAESSKIDLSNFSTVKVDKSPGKDPENSENGSKNDKTGILRTLDKNKPNFSTEYADKNPQKEPENSENGSKIDEILQPTSPTAAYVREFEYKCQFCSKQFRFKRNLMNHQRVHNKDRSIKQKRTKSKKVDQISDRKSSLRLRVQVVVVQPTEIDKSPNRRNSRQIEPKIVKTRIRKSTTKSKIPKEGNHLCKVCDKSFDTRSNLEIHERIHNNDRPYECKICSKSFIQLSHVKAHTRIHLEVKPYKCTTCNQKFRQLSILLAHERLHTGVKPYKCHCGVEYHQLSNLRDHIKRNHYTSDSN